MKLNEVLKTLEENGHPLTRASLYRAGLKNGFLTKEPYGRTTRYIIDDTKFREWLAKATTTPPKDMMLLSEVSKKVGVTYGTLKKMCDRGEIKSFNYGAGKGVTYARLRDAEVAVQIHKQDN